MFPAGFLRVYRESRLLRALEFLFLPLELLVALGGGIVCVSVPVAVLAGVQEVGALEALATMAVAGVFAWWGVSTSYRLVVDLLRRPTEFDCTLDDVVMTKERAAKGGLRDVLVLQAGARSFRVSGPPRTLFGSLHKGDSVRVLETRGSRTVREIWVLRR
jgi:hypothetical protein